MPVTIYHNPRCSKSRQTLQLIQQAGTDHTIVLYRDNPPTADTIIALAAALELPVAELLRRGEAEFKDADDLPDLENDRALAQWLAQHPAVLQRPIVSDETGRAAIGRPPENVLALLP